MQRGKKRWKNNWGDLRKTKRSIYCPVTGELMGEIRGAASAKNSLKEGSLKKGARDESKTKDRADLARSRIIKDFKKSDLTKSLKVTTEEKEDTGSTCQAEVNEGVTKRAAAQGGPTRWG